MRWQSLADRALAGAVPTREEARAVLACPDEELLALLDAAYRVRRAFFGRKVRLHVLHNARSGACPEDCRFCSQSSAAGAAVPEYPMQTVDEIVAGARRARDARAWKYCIVTATRAPSARDLDVVCAAVGRIKAELDLTICTSMGLLTPEKARRLEAAGVDRYNHNLESSERFFPEVASTHTWAQRVDTVRIARAAGMEVCCGGIAGLGERDEDLVDLALTLRELEVESVPVNFLDPRPGTALGERPRPSPRACLKVLAMFRLVHPRADLRAAGGREVTLRALQPLALYAVNSIFTAGYLTTPGAAPGDDQRMILDAGFEIEEAAPRARPAPPPPFRPKGTTDGPDHQGLHADR